MKIVDYNFVDDETANRIMESYGYDVSKKEETVEEITEAELNEGDTEDSEEILENEGPLCVIEREGDFYALCEEVVAIDEHYYIPVLAISEEESQKLDESNSVMMESIDYEEETFNLGDVFEDENSDDMFVALGTYE